jgi:CHAT domain-containing protein/Tfp pilus assembly protein PilF
VLATVLFVAHGQAAAVRIAQPGVVVEEVSNGSEGEKAGIRASDILLAWERPANPPANPEKAEGKIQSVFDWMWLEMEQGPRGTVRIRGERDGKETAFEVPLGRWGIKVRPRFDRESLGAYKQGKTAVESKQLETGITLWVTVAKSAESTNETAIACWMQLRTGDAWAEAQRWKEALAAYDSARGMAESATNSVPYAVTWALIGRAFERQRRFNDAEGAYLSALAVREKHSGESLSLARSLNDLGSVAYARRDLGTAEGYHKRALALREKLAPDSLDLAASLNNVGRLAGNRGDLATAETYLKRALTIQETLAPDSLDLATSLSNLGNVVDNRGERATAEAYHGRALAIREKLAADSLDLAASLSNLGLLARARGELESAETYLQRALAIREKLAPDSLDLSVSLNNLGVVARDRGDLALGEAYYKRALAIVEKLAPDSLELTAYLNNLGNVAASRGELATAEVYHKRALAIREKLAPGSTRLASSLGNLGLVAHVRGDLATAEVYFKRALAIEEKLAPDSLYVARFLANLGVVARDRGELAAAETYDTRALAIEEKLAPDTLTAATSLNNLGVVARDRGELAAAEAYIKRALVIREKLGPDSLDVARSLNDLGIVARARGDLTTAETYIKRALAIREKLIGGSLDEAKSHYDLGVVYRKGHQVRLAADHFFRAIDALEAQLGKLGGSQETQAGFGVQFADYYRNFIDLLIEQNRPADAFHVLERSRARTLLSMLGERDLVFTADVPEDIERERKRIAWEYDQAQARLARLNPVKEQTQIEALLTQIRELRDRQSDVVARIRQRSPRLASLQYPAALDVKGVQAALDPGTLVFSYSIGKDKSYLFAFTPGAELQVHPLAIGETQLRADVKRFRSLIQRAPLGTTDLTGLVERGRQLYDVLMQPAATMLDKATRVLIVPDGPLHALPFAALVRGVDVKMAGARRGWHYLVESKPVHVVVSATVYAELRKAWQNRSPAARQKTLIAFGDPTYPASAVTADANALDRQDAEVRSMLTRGYRLTSLPATRREVAAIATLYREGAETYVGDAATEGRVKGVAKDTRYLHFASHGLLDERFPLNSGLALTIPTDVKEGQDNGILQAWEIFERLRIDADLVVLSACETGLGKEMGGEGLVGLTRAFHYAGARSVVASLWSVADDSTAELMKRFYGYLSSGHSKDAALRRAQLDLIRGVVLRQERGGNIQASHPFYWAAFQLNGDWR